MNISEFDKLYEWLVRDFPPNERTPYNRLRLLAITKRVHCWICCNNDQSVGYAICVDNGNVDYALILQLAIHPNQRCIGIGSHILSALGKIYEDKQGIIVEVTKPCDAETYDDQIIRERRIRFYTRNGYTLRREVDYSLLGVNMFIMVKQTSWFLRKTTPELIESMKRLYEPILSKQAASKFFIRELPESKHL